jgi:hypothetical protein
LEGVGSAVAAADRVPVRVPVVETVSLAVPDAVMVPLLVPVELTVGFIVREGVLELVPVRDDETV